MDIDAEQNAAYERVIRPRSGLLSVDFAELFRYRELFFILAWRDVLVRYKQTYLGIAWAVLQPFLTMVIFTVVFGKMAKFPTHGIPYPVLSFAALLPWQFFSNALTESSRSLIASTNLVSKVYFPRLIIPASAVLSGILDFVISMGILFGLMVWYAVPLSPRIMLLPLFFLMSGVSAFAAGVWLSSLTVKFRDVKYVIPFFTRMGLYACPVGFISTSILDHFGKKIYFLYCLNPMVGVIDGFRWCILGNDFIPYWPGFWISLVILFSILASGLVYFHSAEKGFSDVI